MVVVVYFGSRCGCQKMRPFGWPRIVLTVYGTSFSSCYHTPLQAGVDSLRCTITQVFFLTSPYIYRCYSVYRTYIYIYYTYLLQDIFIYLHTLIYFYMLKKKHTFCIHSFRNMLATPHLPRHWPLQPSSGEGLWLGPCTLPTWKTYSYVQVLALPRYA